MFILDRDCAFLHIPKTGGTFVASILDVKGESKGHKHLPLLDRSLTAFCFVRHPVSWYESYWRWLRGFSGRGGDFQNRPGHPLGPISGCWRGDFNETIAKCIEQSPGFLSSMFHTYTKDCAYVGQQEYLRRDLGSILIDLGLPLPGNILTAPAQNIGEPAEVRWDEGLKREILNLEWEIVEKYYTR